MGGPRTSGTRTEKGEDIDKRGYFDSNVHSDSGTDRQEIGRTGITKTRFVIRM